MFKFGSRISIALAGLFFLVDLGPATAGEKIALVVGNSHYSSDQLNLDNAVKDANDVASVLEKVGFKVFLKTDLGMTAFKDALSEFARDAEHSDVALFYYAGHGVQFKGENYFLPVDNIPRDNKDIKFRSIAMSEVVDAASYSQKIKIIILDACRNSVQDTNKKNTRTVTGIGDASGLAPISGSDGMIVFYSAEHGHQAFDAALGSSNSPFAASLVHHLAEPGRDIKEIFTEVTKDVMDTTEKLQHPEIVTAELTTNVYLNPAESADEAWRRIRESKDPQVFRDFIRQFPDSELADAAQLRLDKFDAERRHQDDERARKDAEAKAAAAASEKDATERRAAAMRDAGRAQTEKLRADKEASERALAERLSQIETARKVAEQKVAEEKQKAIQAAVEADRVAKENAAKEAEAKRLADEAAAAKAKADREADTQRREAAQLQAELKAHQAQQAAEAAARSEAARQQAKLDEDAHRKRVAEEAEKASAEACDRDRSTLADLQIAEDAAAIKSLRAKSSCAAIAPEVDQALKVVANKQAARCAMDQNAVAAVDNKNVDALKGVLAKLKCTKVVDATSVLVARLEESALNQERVCAEDQSKLAAVDLFVPNAKDLLSTILPKLVCATVRVAANESLEAIGSRLKQAQNELIRVGCLTAPVTGRFDSNTVVAVGNYLKARHSTSEEARITDAFVEELRRQDFKICTPPAPPSVAKGVVSNPAPPPKRISARTDLIRAAVKPSYPRPAAPQPHGIQVQVHAPAISSPTESIKGTGF